MNKKILIGVGLLAVMGAGYYFFVAKPNKNQSSGLGGADLIPQSATSSGQSAQNTSSASTKPEVSPDGKKLVEIRTGLFGRKREIYI